MVLGYGGWLVLRLRDEGPFEAPGSGLAPGPGKGEFRGVSFSYVPDREVRKGLNLTLQPGKTTTADLLLKLFKPTKGEILIDGHSIVEAGPAAVQLARQSATAASSSRRSTASAVAEGYDERR